MTRNGKIARLPHNIREEINRRLRDNVPGQKICDWLNRLPAARAVCAEFGKRTGKKELPITVNHLSEWRRGGYQDWLREQQTLEGTRELARWSAKLAKDGGGSLSEGAAVLLSGQLLKLLQEMASLEGIGNIEHRTLNNEHRMSDGANEALTDALQQPQELPEAPAVIPLKRPEGRAPESMAERNESHRRDARATPERLESSVRVLGALVKCLSGIRNGDQNRVRLAQVDRRLAQRDKLIALKCEKYNNEQSEIAAKKKEEQRKKKHGSRLSERTKINVARGRLFGAEDVIAEREHHLEQLQKELVELKAELRGGESSSDGNGTKDGGEKAEQSKVHPPSSDYGATRSPTSNVAAASGTAASSGGEPIRVNTSAYDQKAVEFKVQGPSSAAKALEDKKSNVQGAKKFDAQAVLRELTETGKELAALRGEEPASSSEHSQELIPADGKPGPEFSTKFDPDAVLRELKKFDPDAALQKLEQIKKEVAALKARRQASEGSSGNSQENGS